MKQIQKNKRALLIDLDGTLVDTESLDDTIIKKVLINHKLPYISNLRGSALKDYIKKITTNKKLRKEIEITFLKEYTRLLNETKLEVNVKILKLIKSRKFKIALVTSNTKKITTLILEKIGLLKFFDVVITCEDVENQKPHPEPFLKAIAQLGVNPNECIIFEDSQAGLQSAKLAGINYQKITIERR